MARIKKAKAKERLDKYYKLAKEQGLRARSAFKLVQLNRKFGFLQKARTLLDLGAAPGGWLQIAQKTMTFSSTIIGVDLMPIRPIPGVKTIQGDFLAESTRRSVRTALGNRKVDVVLHDGAPNVSGAWDKDAYVQNVLVLTACKLACEFLTKGGVFVTKVFRSSDYHKLMFVLKELFEKAHATKPESSRYTSAEIFIVCIGYKAPKSVDPKFFNPKDVFMELEKQKPLKKAQAMVQLQRDFQKKKTKASGYETTGQLMYKTSSITEFVETETPESLVRTLNAITFAEDGSEDRFKHSPYTNVLVLDACKDLKVIGLWTMRKLLQWQSRLKKEEATRKALMRGSGSAPVLPDTEVDLNDKSDDDVDVEELQKELTEMQRKQERALKKSQKRVVTKKLKQAVFGQNPEDNPVDGGANNESLFDLVDDPKDLENKLQEISTTDYDENRDVRARDDVSGLGDINRSKQMGEDNTGIDMFGDDNEGDDDGSASEEEEEEEDDERDQKVDKEGMEDMHFYDRIDKVVRKQQKRKRGDKMLDGDVAELPGENIEEDDDLGEDLVHPEIEDPALTGVEDSSSSSDDSDMEEPTESKKRRKKRENLALYRKNNKIAQSGFEALPESMRDPVKRAKIHALATQMLDKKGKRDILESGVNRWCFNDEDLPPWFEREERESCFRMLSVTREEVEQQKARFRALNAMPSKKVIQAIGRKRLKARRILSKLAEKEKVNANTKKGLPSVRQLMRSNKLDKRKIKKKSQRTDSTQRGEKYREWERKKKAGLIRGRGGKKKK